MTTLLKGSWDKDITWEVLSTDKMSPRELVTAVFCVAITEKEEIILARSKRGWGMLGGHVENGELIEDALTRESIEEGGFTPYDPRLFAVMKITPKAPILKPRSIDEYYPFPVSYQLYYWANSNSPIIQPIGEEIIESKSMTLHAIKRLNIPDFLTIELGYKTYQLSK